MSSRLLLLLSLVAISPSLHSQQLQQATHTQVQAETCLLYTSPSPRDVEESRMPSSA